MESKELKKDKATTISKHHEDVKHDDVKKSKIETIEKNHEDVKSEETKEVEKKKVVKKVKPVIEKTVKHETNLPKQIFDVKVNKNVIFDVVISERASRRQGTHKTKNRGEVSGSGIKPWKQKGTGRARAGSLRSPLFVGGGTVFGPQPNRNYTKSVNKKVKQSAFASALTIKAKDEGIFVHDFVMKSPSTKHILKFVQSMQLKKDQKKILFISESEVLFKSTRNIPKMETLKLSNLTIEKIMHYDVLVFSTKDFKTLEGRK